jgi:hypothetical protein
VTEQIAPSCPTLVQSPEDPAASLVCFLSEGHDGWHYDTRGLGVSFRVGGNLGEEVTARFGVGPQDAAAGAVYLPVPFGDASGALDVDALRDLAPRLRVDLIASLRSAATAVRQARGTVVVPEDTYDLVRRTTAAGEVLHSIAGAFLAAAKEADAILEEEALAVSGAELDGVLLASLFVPDGAGQRIAIRADRDSSSSAWDVSTLVGWLIDEEVNDREAAIVADKLGDAQWRPGDAREVARGVVARLIGLDGVEGLGKYTPQARPVEALRKRLAEQQRDADAAVIRQVRQVTPGAYRGVKVTREEAK